MEDKWIKFSESKPSYGQSCFAFCPAYGLVLCAQADFSWCLSGEVTYKGKPITHWRPIPLPKPPKEDSELVKIVNNIWDKTSIVNQTEVIKAIKDYEEKNGKGK